MSLDKAIESGKEHRKQYKGAKRYDKSCRNHGSCPWCMNGRTHNSKVRESKYKEDEIDPYLNVDTSLCNSDIK